MEEAFGYKDGYVALFDFETHDNHFGISTLNELGYGRLQMNEEFLLPIVRAAKLVGLRVVHKPKRDQNGKIFNSKAMYLRTKLEEFDNYTRVDARFSAHAVIAGAKGVISMPPTTTALIAKELMIPSAYFDSVGKILPEDPALDQIDILNSEIDVEKWLRTL
jgi:polysaccharide biosynthesis PFTS motif protein